MEVIQAFHTEYRVFWPSGRVVDCDILVLIRLEYLTRDQMASAAALSCVLEQNTLIPDMKNADWDVKSRIKRANKHKPQDKKA